ncbi:HAMP domain-containing protein [Rhodobacter sp. Har01]|uniref:ATP-binding protein n=1 Tax=Rhodobacter sp. Har01 TaxID=2883999 RepID=UPI001D0616E0|nr:ATP-binding protein [Rhodobacter sp. Har01]MCB6177516.1 HAMP domain-containing protein [Rhodobacter sp. Har01]
MFQLKRFLPRSLYGRAALILIVPIVTIQLVVSTAFIQRHFEGVTRQMTQGVAIDLAFVMREFEARATPAEALAQATRVAAPLEIVLVFPAGPLAPTENTWAFYDLSGRAIIETLSARLPGLLAADVTDPNRTVRLRFATRHGDLEADLSRRRMSASNPHQLLVLMAFTSVLLTVVAYFFLRNQLRPISKLARAAEAFGRGETEPYRPRGALEVRAAGQAFLDMRARIERQIEQRTLMLSGVSHDLRTPLTRMRLGLSMLPEDEESRALLADLGQMERLVDEFLAFVRGDATEGAEETDPAALAAGVVEAAVRGGGRVDLRLPDAALPAMRMRPQAVARALENLVGNGLRHGSRVEVGLERRRGELVFTVEDDGPGIPEDRRDEALRPFTRLEAERDPNRGGGVGLGLSIAADVALSHGGALRLGRSARLGGLRAELALALSR